MILSLVFSFNCLFVLVTFRFSVFRFFFHFFRLFLFLRVCCETFGMSMMISNSCVLDI